MARPKKHQDQDIVESTVVHQINLGEGCRFIGTPKGKDGYAPLDGVVIDDNAGTLVYLYEFRSRRSSLKRMEEAGGVMLPIDKVRHAIRASAALRIPFLYIVYSVQDRRAYIYQVTNQEGVMVIPATQKKYVAPSSMLKQDDKKEVSFVVFGKQTHFSEVPVT